MEEHKHDPLELTILPGNNINYWIDNGYHCITGFKNFRLKANKRRTNATSKEKVKFNSTKSD